MIKNWIEAFRLRTLPLALSSIAMGSFLAAHEGSFNWGIFLLAITTTIFLQVLSNLANDLGDTMNGADHEGRVGPTRAVQSGAISKASMQRAVIICALAALLSGLALLYESIGTLNYTFYTFIVIGILCIAAAIKYTAGRNPYGYVGLGDIAVFLFFGIIGVAGTYYLYLGKMNVETLLPAITCGFFATAVLNLNNMRDIDSDMIAGKNTIPVRLGLKNAKRYHLLLIGVAWATAILYNAISHGTVYYFLFLILLPFFIIDLISIIKKKGADLDPYLKKTALTSLIFTLLWGIGINI